MSTGAECHFYEKELDQWFYKLQRWPYGEWPEYDTYGPFKTMRLAMADLDRNHANPGGFSSRPHKDHVCEFKMDDLYGKRQEICQKCDSPKREKK